MFSEIKVLLLNIIFCFTLTSNLVSSDDVPAMLWNIKGSSLPIKPVSALSHNDKMMHENLKDALHQDAGILLFTVNKLSLEDFYSIDKPEFQNNTLNNIESFLNSQPYMLLPSVKDPLNFIHKAHCGIQEIVVDNKIDDTVLEAVSKALQRSCVVILHVSDEGLVGDKGTLQQIFMPSFESPRKNIIGVFTGVKSSWVGNANGERHIFRNLLQAEASDDNNFVNYTGCIIMYAESATIKVGKENYTALPFPPNTEGSSCGSSTVLQLKFSPTGSLSAVTITLNFMKKSNSWITAGTVTVEGEKVSENELELKTEFISAPIGFSYSCGRLVINGKNLTREKVEIVMERFQVQPYEVKSVFSESFDCVPFFTIPIWMGVFVTILFIMILNIGIYALFAVHTMDRFDDPKGKTISVGVTAD